MLDISAPFAPYRVSKFLTLFAPLSNAKSEIYLECLHVVYGMWP